MAIGTPWTRLKKRGFCFLGVENCGFHPRLCVIAKRALRLAFHLSMEDA